MPIDAVTFDFHNTIAICDDWFQLEIRELVPQLLTWHQRQAGLDAPLANAADAMQIYRTLRQEIIHHGRERDAVDCTMHVLEALNVDIPSSVVREGVDDLMRATLAGSQPVDGVINAVRALSESGVRLGVISNAVYHPFLEWSLAKFGILDCFDVVVTSASAGYYKTRPELYLGTLDRLDAIPERSIHIGDSCRFDVQGARNAGMHAILYSPELSDVRCVEADIEVSTLVDIVPLLFDHFGGASA